MQPPPPSYNNCPELLSPTSREPPEPQDWIAVQHIIHELYVVRKLPLKDVRYILEHEHGFRNASERMFKSRLKTWGYFKSARKVDWGALAILQERRKALGKQNTIFLVKGRNRTVKDLQKYRRSLDLTSVEFLASIQDQDIETNTYIRAMTPNADSAGKESPSLSPGIDISDYFETGSPPKTAYSPITKLVGDPATTMDPVVLGLELDEIHRETIVEACLEHLSSSNYATILRPFVVPSFSPFHTCTLPKDPESYILSGFPAPHIMIHDQLQWDVEATGRQMMSQSPLRTRYGSEDIDAWTLVTNLTPESDAFRSDLSNIGVDCSRCDEPYSRHFASLYAFRHIPPAQHRNRSILNPVDSTWQLPDSTRENDGAWKWIARCFLASMALSIGDKGISSQCLADAATEFESLLHAENPLLWTATQQLASILAMHDQEDFAKKVRDAHIHFENLATFSNPPAQSGPMKAHVDRKPFPQSLSGTGRQLPEDFVTHRSQWIPHYLRPDLFEGQVVDEDERTLELPSHTAPRPVRCLWIGMHLAACDRWLGYYSTKYAGRRWSEGLLKRSSRTMWLILACMGRMVCFLSLLLLPLTSATPVGKSENATRNALEDHLVQLFLSSVWSLFSWAPPILISTGILVLIRRNSIGDPTYVFGITSFIAAVATLGVLDTSVRSNIRYPALSLGTALFLHFWKSLFPDVLTSKDLRWPATILALGLSVDGFTCHLIAPNQGVDPSLFGQLLLVSFWFALFTLSGARPLLMNARRQLVQWLEDRAPGLPAPAVHGAS